MRRSAGEVAARGTRLLNENLPERFTGIDSRGPVEDKAGEWPTAAAGNPGQ